jgi:alkyl sulfatase BDS1-like metallo-beta-lactamase superfamily hydrolase
LISVGNGVLIHEAGVRDDAAGLTVSMARPDLLMTLFIGLPFAARVESGDIGVEGDASLYEALVDLIEPLVPNFPIVTP